jgi:phosphonate transport system permease protein
MQLQAEALGLTYANGTAAFHDVNIAVARGDHLIVTGPSGSGKSSLLACLAGALAPTAGHIERSGRIARIHQDLRLVGQASALHNVCHGAFSQQNSLHFDAETFARARALLAQVGLAERIDMPVQTLSGGEAQRVAIARALMTQPDVILSDEPVAALDIETADSIMQLLDRVRKDHGCALITVLHHRDLAERYATQALHLPMRRPALSARATLPWYLHTGFVLLMALLALLFAAPALFDESGLWNGALGMAAGFVRDLWPRGDEWQRIPWRDIGLALLDTLRMAILGTAFSAVLALPLAALAARGISPAYIGAPLRVLLNIWRAIPSIIWALLCVAAVGAGLVAGIIGLCAYSLGYLSKFYYESFEAGEKTAASALRELGASRLQSFVHALWPATKPMILSHSLFMLEYNVRAASILGVVGAGGLGQMLKDTIDMRNLYVAGAILIVLAAVTLIIDSLSGRLRKIFA